MKGYYKGVLCRLTEYRVMGKAVPVLSYISSPDQDTMLRAGFSEVQNGLWLKMLSQAEREEIAEGFMKRGAADRSSTK